MSTKNNQQIVRKVLLLALFTLFIAGGVLLMRQENKLENTYGEPAYQQKIESESAQNKDVYEAELAETTKLKQEVEAKIKDLDRQLVEFESLEQSIAEKDAAAQQFIQSLATE